MPAVKMVKDEDLDWYAIERAEHDGRMWFQPTGPNSSCLIYSGRISDADVEGTAEEMLGIARAIQDRGSDYSTRCAVRVSGDNVHLWSPRNSREHGAITLAEADALAEQILAELLPVTVTPALESDR